MRKVNKLHRQATNLFPKLLAAKERAERDDVRAIYARVPIPELKEIVLGFDDGTLTRERFNEIWVAAGGKPIPKEKWGDSDRKTKTS